MIGSVSMPAGMLLFGPLADAVPIEWLLRGTGIALMVIALLPLLSRTMLEAGEPVKKLEQAEEPRLSS